MVVAFNKSSHCQFGHKSALANEGGVYGKIAHAGADGAQKLVEAKGEEKRSEHVALLHTARNRA